MLLQYIRVSKKDRRKHGLFIAEKIDEKISIGYSLCHLAVDDFNYDRAKKIAHERVLKWNKNTRTCVLGPSTGCEFETKNDFKKNREYKLCTAVPQSIIPDFKRFVDRCKKYFKTNKKALWIDILLDSLKK